MDMLLIWLEFAVLLACIVIGSRYGGVGLGLWGSFGVFVLTYVVGLAPTSPVSAAMAAMIALFEPMGFGLPQILLVSVPATLIGVIVAALVQTRVSKNLQDDPDYQGRLRAGEIEPPRSQPSDAATPAQLPPGAVP
jgi:anaerobic C4-dicarboxylate transporter